MLTEPPESGPGPLWGAAFENSEAALLGPEPGLLSGLQLERSLQCLSIRAASFLEASLLSC